MSSCRRCLLPSKIPEAKLDRERVCRPCREYDVDRSARQEEERREREKDLERALEECRGKGEYDCLVPLSGGKDSIFLLYKLKVEYGLRILAYTTNVNIPDLAWRNIRTCLAKLDIDHVSYSPSPSFYKKLFRHLLQNQEERGAVYTVSYVYAPLFEGDAIRTAMRKRIPLVLAGYSPGQPEPERMFYEFSRELITNIDWTPPALKVSDDFTKEELASFFNPADYPAGTEFPRYLAPFHAWKYNQQDVINRVASKGLVSSKRSASPILTNYPINWLLMYSDLRHFGYNPYQPEFSSLIREGKASKTYWRIMAPVVNTMLERKVLLGSEVKRSLAWLGLTDEDLRITLPRGAYDPPLEATTNNSWWERASRG